MPASGDIEPIVIQLGVDVAPAAEAVAEFKRAMKEGLEDATVTGVDRANAKLEELKRKYESIRDVIAQNSRQLEDLQRQREASSGKEQQQIDHQIETLGKKLNKHSDELISLDKKRAKLEEIGALENAQSEQERVAIRAATDARIAELTVMQDQIMAQRGFVEEVEKGIPIGRNFFTVMGGWYVLNGLLSVAKSAMAEIQQQMEGIGIAAEKLRGIADSQFSKLKSFYQEMGLTNASGQLAGKNAIDSIVGDTNLTEDVVAGTAAAVGPALGKPVGSDDFRSIVGNASIFTANGMNPAGIANFVAQNPNITGSELNEKLTSLQKLAGGSASRANEFLDLLSDEAKSKVGGFSTEDVEKVFSRLNKTVAPQEVGTLARSAFQGLDRLAGLTPDERESMQDKLDEAGASGLDSLLGSGKPFTGRDVAVAMSKMTPEQRMIVGRTVGGPRTDVGMNAISGFQNEQIPHAGITLPPNSDVQTAASLKNQADIAAANRSPTDPFAAMFHEQSTNELTWLQNHPDQLPMLNRGGFNAVLGAGAKLIGGKASDEAVAASNVLGDRFMQLAALRRDIATGKVKATPDQISNLEKAMGGIEDQMFHHSAGTQATPFNDMISGGDKAGKILDGLKDPNQWFRDNFFYGQTGFDVVDENANGKLFRQADEAQRAIQPKQSSMGPTTIINQNRVVHYGYGYDSIGAPNEPSGNRYG